MSLDLPSPPTRVDLASHACDTCRQRKVKCKAPRVPAGVSPPKCGRCDRLNLPCTFLSPSRTRGPKRRTRGAEPAASPGATTTITTNKHPTDELWDRSLFGVIMQDYLDYIYPLVPIVHRPSFRQALRENRDRDDQGFRALVIAIAAVVVATMPTRFQVYQSYNPPLQFASRREMARCCYDRIMGLRDSTYFDQISFQKFAISYLLYATFRQLGDHNTSRMLDVEATQIARLLNLHRISEYEGLNCIETQLRKKGFWLILYGFVHNQLQNVLGERLSYLDPILLHSINPEDLMPLEVDDEMIFENEVVMSPSPTPCLATGFILHSRVFWAALRSPCVETPVEPCPCVRARDPAIQVAYLQDRLQSLRYLLEHIPQPLRPWRPTDETLDDATGDGTMTQELRSHFASMRANLHVTHLWLQSLLIDQLEAAQSHLQGLSVVADSYPQTTTDSKALWLVREKLCRQLLFVLYSLPLVNLEANGLHLACKVRDIAASLLACPFHPDDPEAQRAAEYLQQSTDILSRLDSSESMSTMHLQTWVDTDRMKK
ncbi:beta-glucosidase [Aspergillus heteromorphus CBS 117.55]|uniref:Beta-glucosidase n=1 Tax=Aspergillus heteromorphus CBS 117.55 TaxID=1448321 RepID=A0A317VN63_9EURO|nr:beta-glucosidase [Aspergillus heteromorphus CBS 117.55]PWY75365.1 beta-glucosidase [Aspergillus heteromorphus CBS 117.55]